VSSGMVVKKPPPQSPNLNAFVQRFLQTLQQECLDHFVVVGERHLAHLVREFVSHYHAERPHQSLGNRPPSGSAPSQTWNSPPPQVEVICRERLGGLLKHYERAAA
jgi:putative transposase